MGSLGEGPLSRDWRCLVSAPAPGPWNMAVDEALIESVRKGAPPFLRFYTWEPGCLSLGRFQNLEAGLAPAAQTLPKVRRTTGGGAIWHETELTYSLGCRQDDLGDIGVKASFERLAGALVDAWKCQGWDAAFARDRRPQGSSLGTYVPACFAGTEEYDILVGHRKLGGNAQRRDREVVFQHGSIPMALDHSKLKTIFLEGFRPDPDQVTSLHECGWTGTMDDLVALLRVSFARRLAVNWVESDLTQEEQLRAEALVAQKFGHPDWTTVGSGALRGS